MPFMIGANPIIRTWNYISAGKVHLRDKIKIFLVHYNTGHSFLRHKGAKDFVIFHLPQIQYKNPTVQCLTLVNMNPAPFIRCFLENGEDIIVDIDGRTKDEILNHVIKVLGKSPAKIKQELLAKEEKENPANFGFQCNNHCICDVMGQVPCPGIVPLPNHMRGKNNDRINFNKI